MASTSWTGISSARKDQAWVFKPMVCGHNAATGREAIEPHRITPAKQKKNVLIVCGGSAGLEAARVSALRGHSVSLFEASDRLGGQLKLAAQGSTRRQVSGVADWLINEITHLNVNVRLNSYIETDDVLEAHPDAVFIATGGWPVLPDIPGQHHLISSWDVLGGEVQVTGDILLIDETGDQAAAVCADVMARAGCNVMLKTPDRSVSHDLGPINSAVVLRHLSMQGVEFDCFVELVSVEIVSTGKRAHLRHVLTGHMLAQDADFIVVENGTEPIDDIYHQLKPHARNTGQINHNNLINGEYPFTNTQPDKQFVLARLGDAVAGRNMHAAIYDALRIAKLV